MNAAVLQDLEQPLSIQKRPRPEPGPGQVLVELRAAALNRRDYWITQGLYPAIRCPVVLGSDGAGVVRAIGPNVQGTWKGREVILNPGTGWGENPCVQGREFQVLGMPEDGTFAEAVLVRAEQLYPKPEHLSWEEAAAVPLAGLTAYRATVVHGQVAADRRVLVTGIGGGVATFALLFARALGATVLVTSCSMEKIQAARALGAAAGYDWTMPDWPARIKADYGGIDVIVDGTGGKNYNGLVELAAPAGTIVTYGATAGRPPDVDLFRVFWKQLRLQGSTLGSPEDFENMMQLIERCRIRPVIDQIFPLDRVNDALERMRDARQFGKIVLRIA
ncbi:MAG TPA: alcohol dehydrogenase [Planctomycetaceae bacterium]|nr:alcohol dehydrogenase [Planctomycetaceae bacterium]